MIDVREKSHVSHMNESWNIHHVSDTSREARRGGDGPLMTHSLGHVSHMNE